MNFQKIYFDLENNDSTGEKKTFYIKKNLRKNQPYKYEINAELFEAGCDWEIPVLYFKIEFTKGASFLKKNKKKIEFVWDIERENSYQTLYNNFCLIPPNDAGNKLKYDEEKNCWYAWHVNDVDKKMKKELKISDDDRKKAWAWLKNTLEKLIDDRHEMLDD